jgi:hypothetical protein
MILLAATTPIKAQLFGSPSQQVPHPAVVRVIAAEPGGASLGSGTLVDVNDEHGLVITNWHVVRDAPGSVIVVFPDGLQSMGRVLRMDSNWDLAAILIQKPRAAPVRVAREAPRVGEILSIAGYGSGSYRAASGACTQYLAPSTQHPFELVELAASARQGDSGGPIFNSSGELAGVLFGEAGGRTTGAYCGRVHSFLTLAVRQLHEQRGTALASTPSKPPPASATGDGWRQKVAAEPNAAWAADSGPAARHDINQIALDTTHGSRIIPDRELPLPTAFDVRPPAIGPRSAGTTATTPIAPLAAIGKSVASDGKLDGIDSGLARAVSAAPNELTPKPQGGLADNSRWVAGESDSMLWQIFAGDTPIAQVKTVLAGLGVLAVLFHGTRAVSRSSAAKKKASAKRS